ncbi:MAG: C4-type zinc ribbon domain-containing protein [Verrucomicrobiota bacterium]
MAIQRPSRRTILSSLISLNFLESEYALLRPRQYEAKKKLQKEIDRDRKKLPHPILGHHDRIRVKGRSSTSPVINWVCRGCFIAVPVGLRSALAQKEDILICENCGSYIYIGDETEDLLGKKKFKELFPEDETESKKGSLAKKAPAKKTATKKVAVKKRTAKKTTK